MQEDYLIINKVPTKLLMWGKTIQDDFTKGEELIVMIPGNPGLTKFYIDFLDELHNVTKIPIWIMSHAGHEIVKSQKMPPRDNEELFSLKGQIRHKECFIEDYVLPKQINFFLIGHSIGSYIILELLKNPSIKEKVLHNYLLFPTIEYMAESPNGIFIMRYIKPFKYFIIYFIYYMVYAIYILPNFIKMFIISIYIYLADIPKRFMDIIMDFCHPYTIQNFCLMGLHEMYEVRQRNNAVLMENLSTIKLYYGQKDSWVPNSYYGKIKDDIPNIDAEMCDKKYKHAFVLDDSVPMAHLVASWIKKN